MHFPSRLKQLWLSLSQRQAHTQQPLPPEQPAGNPMARLARQNSPMLVPTPTQRDAQQSMSVFPLPTKSKQMRLILSCTQAHAQQPLPPEHPAGSSMARLARQSSLMLVPTPTQRDAQQSMFPLTTNSKHLRLILSCTQAHAQQPLPPEHPAGNPMARLARQSSLMPVPTPTQRDTQRGPIAVTPSSSASLFDDNKPLSWTSRERTRMAEAEAAGEKSGLPSCVHTNWPCTDTQPCHGQSCPMPVHAAAASHTHAHTHTHRQARTTKERLLLCTSFQALPTTG